MHFDLHTSKIQEDIGLLLVPTQFRNDIFRKIEILTSYIIWYIRMRISILIFQKITEDSYFLLLNRWINTNSWSINKDLAIATN